MKLDLGVRLTLVKTALDVQSAVGQGRVCYFISKPWRARKSRIWGRASLPSKPVICSLQLCDFGLPVRVA
jgi:hypothetical protein